MGWNDKALQKHKLNKQIEAALNSPQYREIRKKWEQQATLQGFVNFLLVACNYLETHHGYKRNGLINFLKFASGRMRYLTEHESYCEEMVAYFTDEYKLNILEEMGIESMKDGAKNGQP